MLEIALSTSVFAAATALSMTREGIVAAYYSVYQRLRGRLCMGFGCHGIL